MDSSASSSTTLPFFHANRHAPKHKNIGFREYRGFGEPNFAGLDMAEPPIAGDIYVDLSGDIPGHTYRVFVRLNDGWREWAGDNDCEKANDVHIWHPTRENTPKLRPLFYYSDGVPITPGWVSWTGYQSWRKKRFEKLKQVKVRNCSLSSDHGLGAPP